MDEDSQTARACLRCEWCIDDVMKRAHRVRLATPRPAMRDSFIRAAIDSGVWDRGSSTAPLVTSLRMELRHSGMIMEIGDGNPFPGAPSLKREGLLAAKNTPLSKLYMVDAPIDTTAFTIRITCAYCDRKWSLITVNRRILLLAGFLARYFLSPNYKEILPLIKQLSSSSTQEVNADEAGTCTDDAAIFQTIAAAFVVSHEEAHIAGPNTALKCPLSLDDPTYREKVELTCDRMACFSIFRALTKSGQPVTSELALHVAVGILCFLLAARLIVQSRTMQLEEMEVGGYPSESTRIGCVLAAWKECAATAMSPDEVTKMTSFLLQHSADILAKFHQELENVQ
jgi:hypothetical protein